jgi:Fe2+ or Zn2+ uptake regulation protein
MFVTDSPISTIEVSCIPSTAGRCYKCHRFRYCEHQSESGKIICPDCIQTLRNQRLLTEIIPQHPEPNPLRQRKPRQEKPIIAKPQKEAKPRAKYVSSIEKIRKLLQESEKALTAKEIVASGVCGHRTSVYKTLNRLIETGAVVASSDTAKNRVFIDKNRVYLLQIERTVRRHKFVQMNRNRVLNYIKRERRILTIADIVAATNITKKTVIRVVNFWGEAGDLTLIKVSERGNRLHFVPSDNAELVTELMELDQLSTANQVRKILESSDRGVSIGDVMVAMGKGRRNGGSYRYIKKLFEQWGCKTYRRGRGLYYYLGKEESHDQ